MFLFVCVYAFNKLRFHKPETIASCYLCDTLRMTSFNFYKYQILF